MRLSGTDYPISDWVKESLRSYILSEAIRGVSSVVSGRVNPNNRERIGLRTPLILPSSSSACFEWPAARGGVDGYLRHKGGLKSMIINMTGGSTRRLIIKEFGQYCQDSLGTFCLKYISDNIETFEASTNDQVVRCLGVLVLRKEKGVGPRFRACALKAPGMKFRVIGVPDALTFIEGTWIRWTSWLLPKKHFDPAGSGFPRALRVPPGGKFYSVDLSKATDGLSLEAVEIVIRALSDAGRIRSSDVDAACRGLGVGGFEATWFWGERAQMARRGSPMGTPLSFIVLSWVNAWATSAFERSVTHGDDAVGYSWGPHGLEEYSTCIAAVGSAVNLLKTFVSQRSFTLCERHYVLQGTMNTTAVAFCPPPCPPPGVSQPLSASDDQWKLYLRRAERVQKTLFPWSSNTVLRLPQSVGGLGYTGRGLKVPRKARIRLAAACSRDLPELAKEVLEKRQYREEGLFPKPQRVVPRNSRAFYTFRKIYLTMGRFRDVGHDCYEDTVLFSDLVAFREGEILNYYLLRGGRIRQGEARGRPERTKRRALFRSKVVNCAPLTVSHGLLALERLNERISAQRVRVRPDIASEIRSRTTETCKL